MLYVGSMLGTSGGKSDRMDVNGAKLAFRRLAAKNVGFATNGGEGVVGSAERLAARRKGVQLAIGVFPRTVEGGPLE